MTATARTLARAGLIVSGAFLISRVLGWLRLVVIANAIGDPRELDAFFAAFRIPDLLFLVVIAGSFGAAFIPVFGEYIRLTYVENRGAAPHTDKLHTLERFTRLEQWTRERFPMVESVEYRWSGQIMEPVDYMAYIGKNPGGDEHIIQRAFSVETSLGEDAGAQLGQAGAGDAVPSTADCCSRSAPTPRGPIAFGPRPRSLCPSSCWSSRCRRRWPHDPPT